MKRGIPLSTVPLILLLLLSMQEWGILALAPQGCEYYDVTAICYFQQWTPPLQDEDFGPQPLSSLRVHDINGTIPAGAFVGLNGPLTHSDTFMYLHCKNGKTILSRDIFTQNLRWVMNLQISDCYILNGLPSGLLEHLKSLKSLIISGGEIDGFVAEDALARLTDLSQITISTRVKHGNLPSGFFDGLKDLNLINLNAADLNYIHPNQFNGLVSLMWIFLAQNNLQTLPPGLFDELGALVYITLFNNPWNCSCELMWLLDWTNITDGVVCQAPWIIEDVKLEDAVLLLNCTPSNSPIPSTSPSYTPKATNLQTTSSATFSVSQMLHQQGTTLPPSLGFVAMSSEEKGITLTSASTETFTISVTPTSNPMILITTFTSKITSAKTALTVDETRTTETGTITTLLSLSRFSPAKSTVVQTLYSTTKFRSVSNKNCKKNDGTVNGIRYIILSTVGTLTVSLVIATFLY